MSTTISITDDDVFTALRAFLVAVLPAGAEVIQLQDNGVPMPAGGFVGMNNGGNRRLSTNINRYTDFGATHTKSITTPTAYAISLDLYGPDSGAWAAIVQAMFRDESAPGLFPDNIQPLHADGPTQMALLNAEAQYEQRWRLEVTMQTTAVITTPQDFADDLAVGIKSVDAEYPPA